ncbi:MAG: pyridoxamine 5'-phosphate oxidase [Bacteroidetes bacterium]|nr:pyridoxamine 5'-phosphate oxidase [Bacteroidota bacterium]
MLPLNQYTKNIRHDFMKATFGEKEAHKNPFIQFERWLEDAVKGAVQEPNAMVLSTANKKGKPTSRVVLLRGLKSHCFTFFTNYQSKKGAEIQENPYACLLFFWPELERQIRIEGKIVKATDLVSNAYFASRPHESQIGACASPQSTVIKNREVLEKNTVLLQEQYPTKVPRPKNWGGYVLQANYYEFWQGRESRLHDRICYSLQKNKTWKKQRVAP